MTRTTSTVLGANIVNLSPPYISLIYKIYFTQISGPFAYPPILLLTKDHSFFDYNSSAAGLVYDVLVVLQP
jgi:hypothetical protein